MDDAKVWKFVVDKAVVEVNVEPTTNKGMSIRSSQGRVVLLVPRWASEQVAHEFVARNVAKFLPISMRQKQVRYFSFRDMFFLAYGVKKSVYKMKGSSTPLLKERGEIFYYITVQDSEAEFNQLVVAYATSAFKKYLATRVKYFEKIMNLPSHRVAVSDKSSNWATNSLRLKKLIFSVNLFFYDKAIIDYVIIHELSHDIAPNHGPSFWAEVAKYSPDYALLKARLLDDPQMAEE